MNLTDDLAVLENKVAALLEWAKQMGPPFPEALSKDQIPPTPYFRAHLPEDVVRERTIEEEQKADALHAPARNQETDCPPAAGPPPSCAGAHNWLTPQKPDSWCVDCGAYWTQGGSVLIPTYARRTVQ